MYLHLQVDGPLSLKCYLQALEICYIRLCHKAELRTALSVPNPRHSHAPECHFDAIHDPASSRLPPTITLSCTASDQHADKPMQRQASNPDSTSSLMPEGAGASSQAEAASGAPSLAASEAGSGEAADPSDHGSCAQLFGLSQFEYCCMHSPFHKLVRKAFARLTLIDQLRQQNPPGYQATASQKQVSSSTGLCLRAPARSAGNFFDQDRYLSQQKCMQYHHACMLHVPCAEHEACTTSLSMQKAVLHAKLPKVVLPGRAASVPSAALAIFISAKLNLTQLYQQDFALYHHSCVCSHKQSIAKHFQQPR